jgi:hypothetical protein
MEVGPLRWLEHFFRMQEQKPCRKLTLHKPEGTRRVGRPASTWPDLAEDDLKKRALEIGNESHRIGPNGEQS